MLAMPRPYAGSVPSSSGARRRGVSPAACSAAQKRLPWPAKLWPTAAERSPGLMPTKSIRRPGATIGASTHASWLPRQAHHPVELPARPAVEGERLLPQGRVAGHLRPVEAHAQRHALEHVVALEAGAAVREAALDRRVRPGP